MRNRYLLYLLGTLAFFVGCQKDPSPTTAYRIRSLVYIGIPPDPTLANYAFDSTYYSYDAAGKCTQFVNYQFGAKSLSPAPATLKDAPTRSEFSYDSRGRLEQRTSYAYVTATSSWLQTSIYTTVYNADNDLLNLTLQFNNQSYPKFSKVSYNDSHQPVIINENSYTETAFDYEKQNAKSASLTLSDQRYQYLYQYDDKTNPFLLMHELGLDRLLMFSDGRQSRLSFLGSAISRNNPTSIKAVSLSDRPLPSYAYESANMTYVYNQAGLPTEVRFFSQSSQKLVHIVRFTYDSF